MATTLFGDTPVNLTGDLPAVGTKAPDFLLVAADLSRKSLSDFAGKTVIMSIFPSIETGVCAKSTLTFAERVKGKDNLAFVAVSADLPFSAKRWCGAEGVDNAMTLSTFDNSSFGVDYGVKMVEGPFKGLMARSVLVIDGEGQVLHSELVPSVGQEPDYDAAMNAI